MRLHQQTETLEAVSDENVPLKRPFSVAENSSDPDNGDDSVSPITESCDAIRRKIKKFINSGEMKLKGPHAGDGNYTYEAAFRFFERRKKSGIKGPTKKKVKKGKESGTPHVAGVKLEGEEDEYVPVYNICDIVYCEIAAYLRDPEVTQAAFLGKLAKMLSDPMANFQSEQLKDFQCKKGPLEGNSSRIYYTAYVFFESRGPYAESPKARSEKKTRTYGPGEAASIGRDKD